MTRTDHLLWILAEECAELAQRASKAARFGLAEIQPGQPESNLERMTGEFVDLIATWDMLAADHGLPTTMGLAGGTASDVKQIKIEKYLRFSEACGTLDPEPRPPVA